MLGFSPKNEALIQAFLANKAHHQGAAVFDADGTLWAGDIGDDFFAHQLMHQQIPKAPKDAWKVYQSEVQNGNPATAYGWLAQWNAGTNPKILKDWATDFFQKEFQQKIFIPVHNLVQALQKNGVEVWVISASPKFIVQAGAQYLGINPNHVIAATVTEANGLLTDTLEYPVPYRQQKAVLARQHITKPICLGAGNTWWDVEMLTLSTGLALSIYSEPQGGPNFASEQKLRQHALQLQTNPQPVLWLSERFD